MMISCRNMVWAYFRASRGCSASFLRPAMVSSISRSSRSMFSSESCHEWCQDVRTGSVRLEAAAPASRCH